MIRVFRQYIPRSFLVLGLCEFVLVVIAVNLAVEARFSALGVDQDSFELMPVWAKSLLVALVILLCMAAMGLYQRRFRHGLIGMTLRLISAFLLAGLFLSLVFFLLPPLYLGRGVMTLTFLLALAFLYFTRLIFIQAIDQEILKRRMVEVARLSRISGGR